MYCGSYKLFRSSFWNHIFPLNICCWHIKSVKYITRILKKPPHIFICWFLSFSVCLISKNYFLNNNQLVLVFFDLVVSIDVVFITVLLDLQDTSTLSFVCVRCVQLFPKLKNQSIGSIVYYINDYNVLVVFHNCSNDNDNGVKSLFVSFFVRWHFDLFRIIIFFWSKTFFYNPAYAWR